MRRASRRAGDRFDAAECPVLNALSITTPIGPNVSCWHICDIATSRMDFRFRGKNGHAVAGLR
jgi:hypothetical protein